MRRYKRRVALSAAEKAEFLDQAEAAHVALMALLRKLTPQGDAYQGLLALDLALEQAVVELTNEGAPWNRVGPGYMAGM
ncbi:hypothetical protein [Pseudohoeflea coraliihabitans]|uniref:Uncharacterized protein n=1 Tax=Pseudohoeflea coraliihabitans TaxID=2860393 RepID=A0ABS6WKS8_9HYPH|nr:hypothetical protein [Pseudohoeflea sp. DP4N28-3]MBW3096553.1 hypothetical protein [Pseudohoeflea sp. DP4N28-3]